MDQSVNIFIISTITTGVFVLFTVIIAVLLVRRITQGIREKEQHQVELQKTIITTQEAEREVLANNLHDDFGPLLSLLTRKLQQLELDSQTKSIDPAEWTDVHHKLEAIHHDIRKYSHDIFPMQIKKIGLLPSLEYHIRTLQATHRVTFHNDQEINPDFNLAEQLTIYRIFNEVLNNFIKHANASHLDCEISRKKNTFIITLTHNGEPFTQEQFLQQVNKGTGKGCSSIYNRILQLQGEILFRAEEEGYVQTVIIVPNNARAASDKDSLRSR